MSTAIGVLCARVRVEEKQLIAALTEAGVAAMALPPSTVPVTPAPSLHDLAALGATSGNQADIPAVIIDRTVNRAIGRIMNRMLRHAGVRLVDGGISSRRNRLEVATAWKQHGVPCARSLVAFSEESAVEAARTLGYPSTLFPMSTGSAATALPDHDTADAVIEHRVVLGSAEEEIMLLQQGAPHGGDVLRIHVVDGVPVAFEGPVPDDSLLDLAVRASNALEASVLGIDLARIDGEWLAWDTRPVADFRNSTLLGETTVAHAIAAVAAAELTAFNEEVRDVVSLSV